MSLSALKIEMKSLKVAASITIHASTKASDTATKNRMKINAIWSGLIFVCGLLGGWPLWLLVWCSFFWLSQLICTASPKTLKLIFELVLCWLVFLINISPKFFIYQEARAIITPFVLRKDLAYWMTNKKTEFSTPNQEVETPLFLPLSSIFSWSTKKHREERKIIFIKSTLLTCTVMFWLFERIYSLANNKHK